MKWLDEKGRLFGKINLIDLLLVAVILLGAAFAGYKFLQPESVAIVTEKQPAQLTIYGNALHPFVVDKIQEGDVIRLKSNNEVLGTVTGFETGPAILYTSDAEGNWVAGEVPGKFQAYIDIEGQAVISNGTHRMGGIPMLVGERLEVKGPDYMMEIIVSDIQSLSE